MKYLKALAVLVVVSVFTVGSVLAQPIHHHHRHWHHRRHWHHH